jgi:protoporphyrinogen oxidase
MQKRESFAVVGGGMMGLSVAHELSKRGAEVEIFEGASLGGLTEAVDFGPFVWDRFYHCITSSDRALLGLLDELGLGADVRWQVTGSGFQQTGQRHSLGTIGQFLRFSPLRFHQRIQLGLFLVLCSRIFRGERLEDRTAEDFLRRYCGQQAWEIVWRPLLRAKLGPAAGQISARFIWDSVIRLQSARRGVRKREMLGYVSGGYARILDAFIAHLGQSGVRFRVETAVERVERRPDARVEVTTREGGDSYDQVVITVANSLAARMLPPDPYLKSRLAAVDYLGIAVAGFVLRRSISPFYILNISDPNIGVTGLIGTSNLVCDGHFDPYHFYHLPKYLTQDDPAWGRTSADWERYFRNQLRLLAPDLEPGEIVAVRVSTARYVQPLLDCGYRKRVPPIDLGPPGIWLVNSSQCYEGPIHVNMILRRARDAVAEIATRTGL